jgi:hypothetical protein
MSAVVVVVIVAPRRFEVCSGCGRMDGKWLICYARICLVCWLDRLGKGEHRIHSRTGRQAQVV